MTDLGGDTLEAAMHLAIDHQPAAMARADDDAEDDMRALPRTIEGFRDRQAVGVVRQAHRAAERLFQIAAERTTIEEGGVGVADETRLRGRAAGNADADRALPAGIRLDKRDEFPDRLDAGLVALRRRDASPREQIAFGTEADGFHFRSAPIDADQHAASGSAIINSRVRRTGRGWCHRRRPRHRAPSGSR
jgi:hypothetical protein